MSDLYVCMGCNEQCLPEPWMTCPQCGCEQIEPFRVGWDESD